MAKQEGPEQLNTIWIKFQLWKEMLDAGSVEFKATCERASQIERLEGLALILSAINQFFLVIGYANEALGIKPDAAEMKASILENWPSHSLSDVERRIIVTAWAYKKRARLKDGLPKESRLVAAMQIAARMEGLHHDDAFETIRKSIYRYRKDNRDSLALRIDPETLKVEVIPGDLTVELGLPSKVGKPKRGLS